MFQRCRLLERVLFEKLGFSWCRDKKKEGSLCHPRSVSTTKPLQTYIISQECALPRTSTVVHTLSEVDSARKENQEVEALNWFDQQQDIGTDHNLVVEVYKIINR